MPPKPTNKSRQICQLRVTLLDTRPPIWRQIAVPADLTLAKLHDILQIAMGWTNSHLHEFRAGGQRFGIPGPMDTAMGSEEVLQREDHTLMRRAEPARREGLVQV